jgi:putative heme iron utilization protein
MEAENADRGAAARRLVRGRDHAALATTLAGRPYVSLVASACAIDASPILFLSDLAQHTRNLVADPLVSLLFEDTGGHPDPLAGPRLTLLGRAERYDDAHAAARFMARHPASAAYAGFADFHLYRVVVERGHLVAGFGRIAWIEAGDLRFAADASALQAAEADIVAHMNEAHADAVALYAERLLGLQGAGWRITGIDPEGIDLRRPMESGGATARLEFKGPVLTPGAARRALVALPEAARNAAPAV